MQTTNQVVLRGSITSTRGLRASDPALVSGGAIECPTIPTQSLYTCVQVDESISDFSPTSRRIPLSFQVMLLHIDYETMHYRKIMRLRESLEYGKDNSPVKPRQRWGIGHRDYLSGSQATPQAVDFASQSFDLLHEGQGRLEPSARVNTRYI